MDNPNSSPWYVRHRSPLGLFAALLLTSLFFFSGRLEASDEQMMALTARSLAFDASLRFPETYGQTFTGYGAGTPLIGVPTAWLDRLIPESIRFSHDNLGGLTLAPLANALLFALMGPLIAGIVRHFLGKEDGHRLPVARAVYAVLVASPLLPASQTFYSDFLAAVGLLGTAWAMLRASARGGMVSSLVAPAVFAAAAILARSASLPPIVLVGAWGWSMGAPRKTLLATAAGAGVGVLATLAQNTVLRGSPFATGYDGQEFTTPFFTGLHGLLLSPERGLLVFAPVIFLAFRAMGSAVRCWQVLAGALLAYSLMFHAGFWTWHGGWTFGPRFLLPVIALALPMVALGLLDDTAPRLFRLSIRAGLAWGVAGAVLYSAFSAMDAWHDQWGFHQIEARWQFEPMFSLWQNWETLLQEGRFKPIALRLFSALLGGSDGESTLSSLIFVAVIAGVVIAAAVQSVKTRDFLRLGALAIFAAYLLVGAFRGPRGWQHENRPSKDPLPERTSLLRLDARNAGISHTTLVDLRPHGPYTFHAKAKGTYTVRFDGATVMANDKPETPRHLPSANVEIAESGLHLLEVEFAPPPGEAGIFNLYWTWPGGGRAIQPVGGEYALPRELTGPEQVLTSLWRIRGIWVAGGLALLLLLSIGEGRKRA